MFAPENLASCSLIFMGTKGMLDLRSGAARRQLDYGIMEADQMIDLTSLETHLPKPSFTIRDKAWRLRYIR
jgi:hypothetical protein